MICKAHGRERLWLNWSYPTIGMEDPRKILKDHIQGNQSVSCDFK